MATPTTKWKRLAHRRGRDRNPLRRRSDVIEAWLLPAVVGLFLALCPLAAFLGGLWVHADNAATLRMQQSWHPVSAVLLQSAPGPTFHNNGNTWTTWELAQWTFDGKQHSGKIPVGAGSVAGSKQTIFLDNRGRVHAPALTAARLGEYVDAARLIAIIGLAIMLGVGTKVTRVILDRRRLASWETAWLAVGPRWSHQV
jgi:hypothetical protein